MSRDRADEEFLHLVTQNPFLYDKREKQFKNTAFKTKTWAKIGESFGLSGEDASKYFKSLREKYLRLKKEMAKYERSGAGAYYKEKWHLFDTLKFLDEVTRPRKTISNAIRANTCELDSNDSQESQDTQFFTGPWSQNTDIILSPSAPSEVEIELDADLTEEELMESNVISPILLNPSTSFVKEPVGTSKYDLQTSHSSLLRVKKKGTEGQVTPTSETVTRIEEDELNRSAAETARKQMLGTPCLRKKQKTEDKVATTLEAIANSLKQPENEYISAFCSQIEQEMLRMPSHIMEDFKDEVTVILLRKRQEMRNKL